MASLNRVILLGNLTRDPELRFTPDGTSVANLRIAVNRPWSNKQGERETDYFTIVAWRRLAELCGEYLSKGSPVAVDGRLQSRSWETPEGQRRSTIEVVADRVQFLGRGAATTPGELNDLAGKDYSEEPAASEITPETTPTTSEKELKEEAPF